MSNVNLVDGAVVSGSSIAADLAASYVTNPIIGRRARLSGGMSWLDVDFGADVTIDVVVLRFPRDTVFPLTGTITHSFDASGGTAGTGAAHSSGAVAVGTYEGYGYHCYVPSSPVTAQYWRAAFDVPNAFIDIGRAWAGSKFVPERNVQYGYSDAWIDRSSITTAGRSGAEYADEKQRQRAFSFLLAYLGEDDRSAVREIIRANGISKQLLLITNPEASDLGREALIGRFARNAALRKTHFQLSSQPIEVRESL